jgi:hypothetical protein
MWLGDYLRRLTRRDAPDIARLRRLADLPRLAKYIAATGASPFVLASAASDLAIPRTTLGPYAAVLADLYVTRSQAFTLVSEPIEVLRLARVDRHNPALAARLVGVDAGGLIRGDGSNGQHPDGTFLGALFERVLDKILVNTGDRAYRRPDGVAVVPLGLLGP